MKNQLTATYDVDSKRYHRFLIDAGHSVRGVIYIPKGGKIPESIRISLRTAGKKQTGTSDNRKKRDHVDEKGRNSKGRPSKNKFRLSTEKNRGGTKNRYGTGPVHIDIRRPTGGF